MTEYARRHPESSFREFPGEGAFVVMPNQQVIQVVNKVGATIYSLLDGQHSVEAIARRVVEEYDVSEEQALADTRAFLAELAKHGMLATPEEEVAP